MFVSFFFDFVTFFSVISIVFCQVFLMAKIRGKNPPPRLSGCGGLGVICCFFILDDFKYSVLLFSYPLKNFKGRFFKTKKKLQKIATNKKTILNLLYELNFYLTF